MKDIFQLKIQENGTEVFSLKQLEDAFPVHAFFTSRNGGVSRAPFSSLNLGTMSGDNPELIRNNRNLVFSAYKTSLRAVVVPEQVHGADVAQITEKMLLSAVQDERSDFPTIYCSQTDASITDLPGVLLTSLHADCIPVWLYDPVHHAAGLAHAGWKGSRADIAAKTAAEMQTAYDTRPENLLAVIRPGIQQCCFEVGAEVQEQFGKMLPEQEAGFARKTGKEKYHLDLRKINRLLLERIGVKKIYESNYCTCCNENAFFSYRRDSGTTGRMCAGICLL